jgi:hypothetical protein
MWKEVVEGGGDEEVIWEAVVDMYLLERHLDRFRMVVLIVDLEVHKKSFLIEKSRSQLIIKAGIVSAITTCLIGSTIGRNGPCHAWIKLY